MTDHDTLRFYEENALDYSRSTSSRSMDDSLVPFSKLVALGGSVIDLGCGSGRDLVSFLRLGFRPVGLDLSRNLAEIAAQVSDCPVVIGDLSSPPFADSSFDAAWASASLLHLRPDELPSALLEVARILRPLGVFFSSIKTGRGSSRDADGRLFTYYGQNEWRVLLEKAGFAVLHLQITSQDPTRRDDDEWISCVARRNASVEGKSE
ncbi:methyltransferase domain-containing protein [Sinorhizobium medicae]|uniref:class I SAM-dependent DNA methyltransferase n=1 Tax=Rhizobium leguminosarum TaxID=384 RepID=UPI001C960C97|nr:class I SAM-dependent methyltransferase [Rhizobium leguminosarum]MBY5701205.1 class I SAM-dependent methyltransferase [Rhizobium leguminosarum]MDX0995164.1 methyltransferase domain-containing protein [Sinorhizobium medicae]MDX1179024.1 methyltransferase domain-containing protein [Sinorhizobium medicae]